MNARRGLSKNPQPVREEQITGMEVDTVIRALGTGPGTTGQPEEMKTACPDNRVPHNLPQAIAANAWYLSEKWHRLQPLLPADLSIL
jgi:hypothetical protein